MTVTRQDIDFLVATARTAADVEIMPRFANLAAADIKTKAHASDFVTVAERLRELAAHGVRVVVATSDPSDAALLATTATIEL